MESQATKERSNAPADWPGFMSGAGVMLAGLLNLVLMPLYGFWAVATDRLGEPHAWWQFWSFAICGVASLVCWLAAQVSVEQPRWRWPRWITTAAAAVWLVAALPWVPLALKLAATEPWVILALFLPPAAVVLAVCGAWSSDTEMGRHGVHG